MLGANRTHLQSFNLFLAAVLALSVLAVAVFVLTAPAPSEPEQGESPER